MAGGFYGDCHKGIAFIRLFSCRVLKNLFKNENNDREFERWGTCCFALSKVHKVYMCFLVQNARGKDGITMITVSEKAPEFALSDKDGKIVRISDFIGKKVVLYFYSKDNTPGCTRQACAFSEAYEELRALNTEVIGISRDSVESHRKFAQKHGLPFVLLSDPELKMINAYGVWQEKKLYGKVSMRVVRTTFIIDEQGNVEKIMQKVKPDTCASEILEYLRR